MIVTDPEFANAGERIEAHYNARPDRYALRSVRTDPLSYRWMVDYYTLRASGRVHETAIREVERRMLASAGEEEPPPLGQQLPRLVVNGAFFGLETGERWTAIQCSDFNLLNRWQHGEDVHPVLAQRRDAGFNMLRVWTLFDLAAANIGVFTDIDYARLPAFLALCAAYGFYVELTAYTSLERREHWDNLRAAVAEPTNRTLELVNEGDLPVNRIDMDRYARPIGILASRGSAGSQTVPPWEPWDYLGWHTNGASEEQRKIGHNAMEKPADAIGWHGPVLTNETSRFPDVGMWVGSSPERVKALAFDSAAGAALLCAGSCFHSAQGKASVLWDDATRAAAEAWVAGVRSVNVACQAGRYDRRDDLLTDILLRVYQRGTCIVPIRK